MKATVEGFEGSASSGIEAGLDRLQHLLRDDFVPDQLCYELSKLFHVRDTEVALLSVEGSVLKFLFPAPLRQVGTIPMSGAAIAARTALSKKSEVFNSFTKIRHAVVFETIRLGDADALIQPEAQVIQKLMSAPVVNEKGKVWGILQISRKGADAHTAGPDFTREDLEQLTAVARLIGKSRGRA
jgi:GAF domain